MLVIIYIHFSTVCQSVSSCFDKAVKKINLCIEINQLHDEKDTSCTSCNADQAVTIYKTGKTYKNFISTYVGPYDTKEFLDGHLKYTF